VILAMTLLALPAQALAGTAAVRDVNVERVGPGQAVRYVAAPGEANSLTLSTSDDWRRFVLHDTAGIEAGRGCVASDAFTVTCTLAPDVETVGPTVRLGDRDDSATVGGVLATVYGGAGADSLRLAGIDGGSLNGGPGDDRLAGGEGGTHFEGGPGDDDMTGGPSADAFFASSRPDGSDAMHGGGGRDGVYYDNRQQGVRISLDGVRDDGGPGERDLVAGDIEDVEAGRGDDVIVGSAARNKLRGAGGSDVVRGGPGDDVMEGALSYTNVARAGDRDRLYGGAGHDFLAAGSRGSSLLVGGPGQDQIDGGPGRDAIRAADGEADRVTCGRGVDRVVADGHDFVAGPATDFAGRCDRIARRGRAAAVLSSVGPRFVNTTGSFPVLLEVGCPADGRPLCQGQLDVRDGDRVLLSAGFQAVRGAERGVRLRLPADLVARVASEGFVTISATVTSAGRQVRRQPLLLTSDLSY
jgi:Ca2+-binding RTX toxin-like protein